MKRVLTTTITLLALSALVTFEAGAAEADKPNIIFILADDMGYGDLGCYGAAKIKTPNIDRLAREGILFTDGHCGASTCTPTWYGLMTGRHPWRSWCKYSVLSTNAPLLIADDRVTVAFFLKSAGYATSIVGKWHLAYGHEEGFEETGVTQPRISGIHGAAVLTGMANSNPARGKTVLIIPTSFPSPTVSLPTCLSRNTVWLVSAKKVRLGSWNHGITEKWRGVKEPAGRTKNSLTSLPAS